MKKRLTVLLSGIMLAGLVVPSQVFSASRGPDRGSRGGYFESRNDRHYDPRNNRHYEYRNRGYDYYHRRDHDRVFLNFGLTYWPSYAYRTPQYYPVVSVEQTVLFGEVVAITDITMEGTSGVGGVAGGAIGAVIGNSVGGGLGKAGATIAGAIVGAVTGNAIEKQATARAGVELTLQMDDGRTIAIAQEKKEQFLIGDRVQVIRAPSGIVRVNRMPDSNVLTINIPNSNGSYTSVQLTRNGDGYTGPQGEYYPGHPTVDQLKALYGK